MFTVTGPGSDIYPFDPELCLRRPSAGLAERPRVREKNRSLKKSSIRIARRRSTVGSSRSKPAKY
jgi:hypothetical protein